MQAQNWAFWIEFIAINEEGMRGFRPQLVRARKSPDGDGKILLPMEIKFPPRLTNPAAPK